MTDDEVEALVFRCCEFDPSGEHLGRETRRARASESRLAAENAELRKLAADLARVMDRDGARQPDHACAECVPYSDILVAGFRCAYHRAKEVLRAR